MSAPALFLAAAAASQPAYPVTEVLDAFKEVCFTRAQSMEATEERGQYVAWRAVAQASGWTELLHPVSSEDRAEERDYRAFYQFRAIDHAFIGSMLEWHGKATEPASAIFKKQVAGRTVYVSMMATDGSNPSLSECRLHDPLGDGVNSSPVSKEVLEAWSGSKVQRRKGEYGGKLYAWSDTNGAERNVRVHFGFDWSPLPRWGASFRPYAIYGLTLVVSNYSLIIVT